MFAGHFEWLYVNILVAYQVNYVSRYIGTGVNVREVTSLITVNGYLDTATCIKGRSS